MLSIERDVESIIQGLNPHLFKIMNSNLVRYSLSGFTRSSFVAIYTSENFFAFAFLSTKILAQAEMMAANEEQIQNRQNSRGGTNRIQPITSSYFASALQAARANLVSTSTQTAAGEVFSLVFGGFASLKFMVYILP